MSKHLRLASLALAISFSAAHAADTKGITWSGNVMGGYFQSWHKGDPSNAHGFMVDRMKTRMDAHVSDRTKAVFQTGTFLSSGDGANKAAYDIFSSHNFTSRAAYRLAGGSTTNSGFTMAAEAAYIDHKCMDGVHTWVGLFATPFGMESMWDRVDMNSYYYSSFYGNNYVGGGINNDLGLKFAISEIIPGTLEVAFMDGRGYGGGGPTYLSPALALRYSMEHKSGDLSITPVASLYMARWAGFAKWWMGSIGMMAKMGAIWGNLEFLYSSNQPNIISGATPAVDGKDTRYSLVLEPGFDAGVANFSLKAEMTNATYNGGGVPGTLKGNTDYNLGLAVSHTYEGDYTVKLAYAMASMNGKVGGPGVTGGLAGAATAGQDHINDLRLIFSTKW